VLEILLQFDAAQSGHNYEALSYGIVSLSKIPIDPEKEIHYAIMTLEKRNI
jgi:hypothetical protein